MPSNKSEQKHMPYRLPEYTDLVALECIRQHARAFAKGSEK